mgnify:FL=1|tara:strand:+ start:1249 stop:1995 length:747 start_codon:yes stop_codon:yes gene_type:complete
MKSNNPFKVHNINYLSPSSINTYINDMPMWITRYLFGIKSPSGASAVRGIAQEFVLANKYEKGLFDFNLLDVKFMSLCAESNIDLGDIKTAKEKKLLKDFGNIIDENFNYKNLVSYQEKVEVPIDDMPVPIMGYIDFRFTDSIVDLKTTTRMPSKPTEAQKRQMALYSMAYPNNSVDLFFATPKEHKKFTLKNLSAYKKQLVKVALSIQKFLSISNDKHELASLVYPNLDSWMWAGIREEAKKIWKEK